MGEPARSPLERLRRAAADAKLPTAAVHSWHATPPDPAAGQLWRARWDQQRLLVVLLAVTDGTVTAAPASEETELADPAALIVAAVDTPVGTDLAVWPALQRDLPMRVLDRCLGQLRSPTLDAVHHAADRASENAADRSAVDGAAPPLAAPPVGSLRREYQAVLVDALDELAAARWAPTGNGQLAGVLAALGLAAPDIGSTLDVAPARALALVRGEAALTAQDAQRLAARTGRSSADLLAANPGLPEPLVARLDRPSVRARVDALAGRRGVAEQHAWREVGYGVYALAARQTGADPAVAWDERIDRYLAVHLDD